MVPILFSGFPQGSSLGLVAAFEWLGQPYRIARVDMLSAMKNARYASVNGRQETPVLVTADGVLTETMAIAGWLEARDVERRISFEPRSWQAHRMHQLMAFVNSSFTGAFSPLWAAMEMEGASEDLKTSLRAYGREGVVQRHAHLEAMLPDGTYAVGDKPSLADAVFIGVARWATFHEALDRAAYPRIVALERRLEADAGVAFAHAIEDGRAARGRGAMREIVTLDAAIAEALALI